MRQADRLQVADEVDVQRLHRSLRERRTLLSALLSTITRAATVIACIPLFSVLIMLLWRGAAKLSWHLFVDLPPTPFEDGGGFGNAVQGTLAMVSIAAVISVPFGVLAAVFLAEFGPDSKMAAAVRFCAKTLMRRLEAGLILRALVDDLAVVHVELARVHVIAARDGVHMEVVDPMEVGQRKGKALSLFGRDKLIDINRMNRLITSLIATTVAQWFIASGEAGQKDIGHHDHPSRINMPAMAGMLMNDAGDCGDST